MKTLILLTAIFASGCVPDQQEPPEATLQQPLSNLSAPRVYGAVHSTIPDFDACALKGRGAELITAEVIKIEEHTESECSGNPEILAPYRLLTLSTPEGHQDVVFLDTHHKDADVQVGAQMVVSLTEVRGQKVVAGHVFLNPKTTGRRPAIAIPAVSLAQAIAAARQARCPNVVTDIKVWDDSPEDCAAQPIEDIRDDAVRRDDESDN